MQRRTLACVAAALAVLPLGPAAYPADAAEKGWFGMGLRVDADGWVHPVVKSITVTGVVAGSPAAQAGIAAGDALVEVQGIAVAGGNAEALGLAVKKAAGETLRLKIRHGGDIRELSLVAAAAPAR